jgi:flagellum-specific peptidoglycan hydrolase FlgJ
VTQAESIFLSKAAPAAMATQRQFGVPASITLAQAITESGWGRSELALQANNFFGIKATHLNDPGTYVEMPTDEYVKGVKVREPADFEKYISATESFKAHAQLLSQAVRYKPAMAVANDPDHFAIELQVCGYSTSPHYAVDLMILVREFDLQQYDVKPEASPAAPAGDVTHA